MGLGAFAAWAASETVDGIEWTYSVADGVATVQGLYGGPAIPASTAGAIEIPARLGGVPVTGVGRGAFYNCSNLVSVSIAAGVTNIGEQAFGLCAGLETVSIPDSVVGIGASAFFYCTSLKSVAIPGKLEDIGASAFSQCRSLTSVSIPANVASIGGGAFSDCRLLAEIGVAEGNPHFAGEGGVLFSKDMGTLLCCPGGKTGAYAIPAAVATIAESAFASCEGLTSVAIPDGVATIGNMAFSECYGLTSIVIPDSVTSLGSYAFVACGLSSATIGKGITSLGEFVFGSCSDLETLDIPDNVTSIGFAFKGCSGLTKVTIGSGVTNIHLTAFSVCPGLKEIIVSGENPAFASEEGVLFDKAKSRLATCPPGKEGVCPVPESVTVIDEGAFSGCSALTAIEVAPGNGHYSSEDGVLFDKDRKTLVRCPSSKTGSYGIPATVTAILDSAFQSCSGLAAVEIPPAVTNIGYSAFRACSALESLALPDSVTAIGDFAFYESGLKTLSVPGAWEGTTMLQVAMVPFGCEVIYRSAPEDPVTRTPVPVPYSWLAGHGLGDGTEAGYEAAAAGEAANGRKVWECYGADISPTDAGADFKVKFVLEDGQWVPKPDPEHPGARRYVVEGSPALGEGESWGEVNAGSRFFRAKVMLP